jgi:hypothetical protein
MQTITSVTLKTDADICKIRNHLRLADTADRAIQLSE